MRHPEVELFAWNPDRELAEVLGGPPILGPVRNFGDLLGPLIVERTLHLNGYDVADAVRNQRLLTVGSVLHFAEDGDVIWGTGINGKAYGRPYWRTKLDIRAVRGPLTAARLRESGHDVPPVYGDPGSLVGRLWPRQTMRREHLSTSVLVVPNFNDLAQIATDVPVLDPRSPVHDCLQAIASSRLIIASSLHALIVAEAYGVPAIRLKSDVEPDFKYDDYYLATGRPRHQTVASVEQALLEGPTTPAPTLHLDALAESFPFDLWLSPA